VCVQKNPLAHEKLQFEVGVRLMPIVTYDDSNNRMECLESPESLHKQS